MPCAYNGWPLFDHSYEMYLESFVCVLMRYTKIEPLDSCLMVCIGMQWYVVASIGMYWCVL